MSETTPVETVEERTHLGDPGQPNGAGGVGGEFGTEVLALPGCENATVETVGRSPLHDPEQVWSPTNCYVDVWIGLLAALGLDPVPMLSCAVGADFVAGQWEFLKPRSEDLEWFYGLHPQEYDTWRPLPEHVREVLSEGHALIVETDSYYLPDTAGVSYGTEHVKSSIVPLRLDPAAGELLYLHNDGVHTLSGADLHRTLGTGIQEGKVPFPYVELVRLDTLVRREPKDLWRCTVDALREHLRRVPSSSPAQRLVDAIREHVPVLAERGMEYFHLYSFATTRQCGLTAALAAHVCRYVADGARSWGSSVDADALDAAAQQFDDAAAASKTLQFQLARAAAGRTPRIDTAADALVTGYDAGMAGVIEALGD